MYLIPHTLSAAPLPALPLPLLSSGILLLISIIFRQLGNILCFIQKITDIFTVSKNFNKFHISILVHIFDAETVQDAQNAVDQLQQQKDSVQAEKTTVETELKKIAEEMEKKLPRNPIPTPSRSPIGSR